MKEQRPVGWTERLVVTLVLAFALAAIACGLFVYPLYQEVVALRAENQELKNEVNRSRQDLVELHRDRRRMAEELANMEYTIATYIKSGRQLYPNTPGVQGTIPDVRTKVVDVRPESGHVALGAGKKSGIKEGFVFLIHRGDRYVGKVRVTTVWDNFSGGVMLERKQPIKTGDDAMTDTTPGG